MPRRDSLVGRRDSLVGRRDSLVSSPSPKSALRDSLSYLGLPPGLLASVYRSYKSTDSRLWLLDNSSRMTVRDSHVVLRVMGGGAGDERVDGVTRWEELRECVLFHSDMAARCRLPSKYCLVNDDLGGEWKPGREWEPGREYTLCWGPSSDADSDLDTIRRTIDRAALDSPLCPLRFCVRSLSKYIDEDAPAIEARGQRVTVVVCTQGRATNRDGEAGSRYLRDFQEELGRLSKLPVRIVIRLTTDSDEVRDVFNTMDSRFDAIDVLDDFWGEALEVYLHNPWLTYAMGLHRLRESGLAPDLMDDLDERPLALGKIHELCRTLFLREEDRGALPHPDHDRDGFLSRVSDLAEREGRRWNPIKKGLAPWIDVRKLRRLCDGEEPPFRRASLPPRHIRKQRAPRHEYTSTQNPARTATGKDLMSAVQRWGFRPPDYREMYPLERLLCTVPNTFPANNPKVVEQHAYFAKWKAFDPYAFADHGDDERRELLKRAMRKAKFFLNPDKWPNNLTNNQTVLLNSIRNVIKDQEDATLG